MTVDKRLIDALLGRAATPSSNMLPVEPLSPMGSFFDSLAPPNPFDPIVSRTSDKSPTYDIARALWPALPAERPALTPAPRPEPVKRLVYFAFDFDDLMRVNNVRQVGKIVGRVMGGSRGFKDRSVWEASRASNDRGLKEMMQRMSKFSSSACVLIGTNTWASRWVRYEIALAIINERGLLAVDINSIKHHVRLRPDPLGVNPLSVMGLRKDADGSWHLVERRPVESKAGHVSLEWHWYEDYQPPVPKPKFVPDIEAEEIIALSSLTKRYDFMGHSGSINSGTWMDVAAIEAGR